MNQLGFDWQVETSDEVEWRENEEKGLTKYGWTRSFDGVSKVFYLDDIEITCPVNYFFGCTPHVEFHGEPSYLTSTGYRSYFSQGDLVCFASIEKLIEWVVEDVLRQQHTKVRPYTLHFGKED